MPLSYEAGVAETELEKLRSTPGISPPSFGYRKNRADLLNKAKRYAEAADAYRGLLGEASAVDRPGIELSLAYVLDHTGQTRDAKRLLDSVTVTSPEVAAERLFEIG